MKRNETGERCPCGSGKLHRVCCGQRRLRTVRTVVVLGLCLGVVAAITALGLAGSSKTPDLPVAATPAPWQYDPVLDKHWHAGHGHWHDGKPPATLGGDGVAAPPNVTDPEPWQYDAATDRHYDPGHAHWHSGRPPAGVGPDVLTSPVGSDRVDPPPNVPNPQPWQYDAGTDRHFHPGHAHWHAGPPPDPSSR